MFQKATVIIMATLGQDTFNWVRRVLESTEQDVFRVSSDPNITVWVPPSQETLQRLDFLTRLYCQCQEVVELESKPGIRFVPDISPPSDVMRHSGQ